MTNNIFDSLWIEKYRPTCLKDIILPDKTREILENYKKDGVTPNLLLCSKPGQGKTSLAKIIASEIYEQEPLFINCSDKNSVDDVRNSISNYAKSLNVDGKMKLAILDEADGFANIQSQKILRNLMEEVSDNTRFIITGNYKNKIIEAIRSRCYELTITPPIKEVLKRVLLILLKEKISFSKEKDLKIIDFIVKKYYPDVRSILKNIQLCSNGGKFEAVHLENYYSFITELFDMIKNKKLDMVRKKVLDNEHIFQNDYQMLLSDLYNEVISNNTIDSTLKAKWVILLSDYSYRSSDAIDPELNAMGCFYSMMI